MWTSFSFEMAAHEQSSAFLSINKKPQMKHCMTSSEIPKGAIWPCIRHRRISDKKCRHFQIFTGSACILPFIIPQLSAPAYRRCLRYSYPPTRQSPAHRRLPCRYPLQSPGLSPALSEMAYSHILQTDMREAP